MSAKCQSVFSRRQINRSTVDCGGVSSPRVRLRNDWPGFSVIVHQINARKREDNRYKAGGQQQPFRL
jgi:hypothetical protein